MLPALLSLGWGLTNELNFEASLATLRDLSENTQVEESSISYSLFSSST